MYILIPNLIFKYVSYVIYLYFYILISFFLPYVQYPICEIILLPRNRILKRKFDMIFFQEKLLYFSSGPA